MVRGGRHPFFGCRYCLLMLPVGVIFLSIFFYLRLLVMASHEKAALSDSYQAPACDGFGIIVDRQQSALAIPNFRFKVLYDWGVARSWIRRNESQEDVVKRNQLEEKTWQAITALWPENDFPARSELDQGYKSFQQKYGSDTSYTRVVTANSPPNRICLLQALRARQKDFAAGFSLPEAMDLASYHCAGISEGEAKKIEGEWNPVLFAVRGVTVKKDPYFFYPEKSLAAHLLGFSYYNSKKKEWAGALGVLYYYQQYLRGERDFQGRNVAVKPFVPKALMPYLPSQCGHDLVLTVRRDAQLATEDVLRQAIKRYHSDSGLILAMDPRNGEIISYANWPTFDPNHTGNTDQLVFRELALYPYEPGSVFKPFVVAAAMESLGVTPDTIYHDSGSITYGGHTFRNAERKAYGDVTVAKVLAESLNVDMVQMAIALGPQRFYKYVLDFGFDAPTGEDFGPDNPGMVRQPGNPIWSNSDLAAQSFGQALQATPVQLVAAYGALANNGVLMRPHAVLAFVQDGKWYQVLPKERRRVIRPETAHQVTTMLEGVVHRWAGDNPVPGYRVAGKTGTAEIAQIGKGYNQRLPDVTFIGYLPADNPQLVILVKLHQPAKGFWAYNSALPTFMEAAKRLTTILNVPPSKAQ